jgi:hypothetical protein
MLTIAVSGPLLILLGCPKWDIGKIRVALVYPLKSLTLRVTPHVRILTF